MVDAREPPRPRRRGSRGLPPGATPRALDPLRVLNKPPAASLSLSPSPEGILSENWPRPGTFSTIPRSCSSETLLARKSVNTDIAFCACSGLSPAFSCSCWRS